VQKRQQESYDRILKCITHLIYLLVETARTDEQKEQMREMVTALIRSNPRSASTGDTLLHLCVSRLNTIKSAYFSDDNQVCKKKIKFPSTKLIYHSQCIVIPLCQMQRMKTISCFQTKVHSYASDQGGDWENVKKLFKCMYN